MLTNPTRIMLAVLVLATLVVAGCTASQSSNDKTPVVTYQRPPGTVLPGPLPTVTVVPSPLVPAAKAPDADGIVRFTLTIEEKTALIDEGIAYTFWTFGGTVPGPVLRVKEGAVVELTLVNPATSTYAHNIDLHAVTGPGGGAKASMTAPGEQTTIHFTVIRSGAYVYHCATPPVTHHIANGMFGMIIVDPKVPLPAVDHEYYIMQTELYSTGDYGQKGIHTLSHDKMVNETPTYYLMNGKVGALTGAGALTARTGESVRIYYGVGGFVASNFHVIGEIYDTVYIEGGTLVNHNVQTTIVPAGGTSIMDFEVEVPGDYILVDHALMRSIDHGAVGILSVSGDPNPDVYKGAVTG